MFYSASVLLRCFWAYTSRNQSGGKKAMLFVGLLGNLPAQIGQVQREIVSHCEKSALF